MNIKQILLTGTTILALLLAACGPTGNTTGTDIGGLETTSIVETPAGTAMDSTEVGAATSEATTEATSMPTAEGTATANEPLLIRASDLLGLDIVGTGDVNFGVVTDVLVGETGLVQYILLDTSQLGTGGTGETGATSEAAATSDTGDTSVTAEATSSTGGEGIGNMSEACTTAGGGSVEGTGSAGAEVGTQEARMVAAPWLMFDIQTGFQQLVFCGAEADLLAMPAVDMTMFDSDDDFVVGAEMAEGASTEATAVATGDTAATADPSTSGTTTPADAGQYEGLIRVSQYNNISLLNAENEELGGVEDLVIDLNQGQVQHSIVNFGGFLGIGDTSVAVPWGGLQLVVPTTIETNNGQPYFLLDVPRETLEQAPAIEDLDQTLPRWPDTINPSWHTETDSFWQTAGI